MSRDAIQHSPPWTGAYPVTRAYEDTLVQHYGGTAGWIARDRNVASKSAHGAESPVR
jgi:hypothetical protein